MVACCYLLRPRLGLPSRAHPTCRRRTDGSLWRPDPAVLRWPPVRVQRVIPAVRLDPHGTVQEDAVPGGRQDRDVRQRAGGQPDPGAAGTGTALQDLTLASLIRHEVVDGQDRVTQRGGPRLGVPAADETARPGRPRE